MNISNRNERYPGPGSYISFSEFGILDPNYKKRGRLQTEPSKNKETEPEQTKNEDNYEDFENKVDEKPKLKETRKASKELEDQLESTKKSAESLKNAFNEYDTAIDKLKECTKGTKEWEEAL